MLFKLLSLKQSAVSVDHIRPEDVDHLAHNLHIKGHNYQGVFNIYFIVFSVLL